MPNGVKFLATRAAIERARLVFPRQIYDHLIDDILAAVSFDEGAVAEKLAEITKVATPDHVDTPLDGGSE